MDFDSPLPPAEFFLREVIETARLVETDDTAAHRGDNRGLASRDPAFCVGGRQIGARLQHDSPRSINDVLRSLVAGRVFPKPLDTPRDSNEAPDRDRSNGGQSALLERALSGCH